MYADTPIKGPLAQLTHAATIAEFFKVERDPKGYITAIIINPSPKMPIGAPKTVADIPTAKKLLYAALACIEQPWETLSPRNHSLHYAKDAARILGVAMRMDPKGNWRQYDYDATREKEVTHMYNRAKRGTSLGDFQREQGFVPKGLQDKHDAINQVILDGVILNPAGFQALAKWADAWSKAVDAVEAENIRLESFEGARDGRKVFAQTLAGAEQAEGKPFIEVLADAGVQKFDAETVVLVKGGRTRQVRATASNAADMLAGYLAEGYIVKPN
jgi:hypothetical protein